MNQPNIYKTSKLDPKILLLRLSFWKNQKIFLLIIALTVFISFFAFRLTYSSQNTLTCFLNIIIHSLAVWGIFITIKILAEIEVETAIILCIESSGKDYLEKVSKNGSSRMNLDQLSTDFVPNNLTEPPLAMIRLFRRICKEAKDRKFESSIYLIQPYREESIERVNAISSIQKMALRLGILGTFIGLILAISQLAEFQFNDINNQGFETIINTLFGNLYIAFSTSIAGLEVSILLGILLMFLRYKQKAYFQQMEDTVLTFLSVARNSTIHNDFLSEFQQVTHSIQDVEDKIQQQTHEIQVGLNELEKAKFKFDNFLSQLSEKQKRFIDETQDVYDIISIKNINDHLTNSIIKAGDNVSKKLEKTGKTMDSQTTAIQSGINKLEQTQSEFSQFLDEISNSHRNFVNDVTNTGRELRENSKTLLILSKNISELQKSLENHSPLIQKNLFLTRQNKKKSLFKKFLDLLKEF